MNTDAFENQPTRRRPLIPQGESLHGLPSIRMYGPDVRAARRLLRSIAGTSSADATVSVAGIDIRLTIASNTPTTESIDLLCIDDRINDRESQRAIIDMLLNTPALSNVAIVSNDVYPDMEVEHHWRDALASEGLLGVRLFRVNASDSLSTTLFLKLLLAPSRDAGAEKTGIIVED